MSAFKTSLPTADQNVMPAATSRAQAGSIARPAVHQFHSGSAVGDAVTNAMLMIRGMLRRLGFESEIYAEHVAPELAGELHAHHLLNRNPGDVLLIHHSMGHDLDDWILQLPGRNILCYHNITPASFFPPSNPFHHYAQKGRQQLVDFRPVMERAIAVSELNASELREAGYDDVTVLPLLLDVDKVRNRTWNRQLALRESSILTVLFVGRVSSHKGHADLIKTMAFLRAMCDEPIRLVCVGGYDAGDPYYEDLQRLTAELGLQGFVQFTGKVSDEDLGAWYRAADVFLCMSEHEGFGVPLIEAMALDVPVVAFDSGNVAATLSGAGILVRQRNHGAIAGLVKRLCLDRQLRASVLAKQRERVAALSPLALTRELGNFLASIGLPRPPLSLDEQVAASVPRYQFEGPLETSYSLALVNRRLALEMESLAPTQVAARPTEGNGDYPVDRRALEAIDGLAELVDRRSDDSRAVTLIRNLYPPRVADMRGDRNLLCFAWEESGLPPEWVMQFNTWLDGIGATSTFVKKVLRDNGVHIPITVYGHGVDHHAADAAPAHQWDLPEGFRFLHVSSCFPRKGADVLLQAYCEEFRHDSGVTLVIKTFPNPHNTVAAQVRELQALPGCPRIVLIERDVPDADLQALYKACDAFVAPSRGEGFGLPMAEAMLQGLPVITTAYGGQADFCTEETAWLVDYRFAAARSHLGVADSMWVEPDLASLRRQMRAVASATDSERRARTATAQAMASQQLRWNLATKRLVEFDAQLASRTGLANSRQRLGWVSSWNAKCGIATYSSFLLRHLNPADFDVTIFASELDAIVEPDDDRVVRCWTNRHGTPDKLTAAIEAANLDTLMIQYNFGFLSTEGLGRVIRLCHRRGITVLVTFHSTKDIVTPGQEASLKDIRAELALADRLVVHSVDDVNRLKALGLVDNVCLFPHGVTARTPTPMPVARAAAGIPADAEVIAAYGFMLPHKGLEQLIEALPQILQARPKAMLLLVNALYPGDVSREVHERCQSLASSLGCADRVRFCTEFLPDDKSFALLDCADLVAFPYQNTAESASGAVRYGIASHRPVICTPLPIFSDVEEIVHSLPGTTPDHIARGIVALLANPEILANTASRQSEWLRARAWPLLAYRLGGVMRGLRQDRLDS